MSDDDNSEESETTYDEQESIDTEEEQYQKFLAMSYSEKCLVLTQDAMQRYLDKQIDCIHLSPEKKQFILQEVIENMICLVLKKHKLGSYPVTYRDKLKNSMLSIAKQREIVSIIEEIKSPHHNIEQKIKILSNHVGRDPESVRTLTCQVFNPELNQTSSLRNANYLMST